MHADQPVDAALVAAIKTALPVTTPVFQQRADRGIAAPYVVVQPLGGSATGSVADQDDHVARYQITYVGQGPEQAAGMADRVRALLVMSFLTVTGRHVGPVELDYSPPDLVEEDADVAIFLKRHQYVVPTTAA